MSLISDFFNIDENWTLFLDRDGVINERIMGAYVTKLEDFHLLEGVLESITQFSKQFCRVLVVTNQQGISKGLMTEQDLHTLHDHLRGAVEHSGGKIDQIYFAPELKGSDLGLRKPNPGMALAAKNDFPEIDFTKSIMVGDTDSDILFGKNLGMKTVRIKTEEPIGIEADLTVNNLFELTL